MKINLASLQNSLCYKFKNTDLLKQALSHSSYTNKSKSVKLISNERLEFLGDRVLGLAVAHQIYELFSDTDEGRLAVAIAYLNSSEVLYKVSSSINLQKYLLIKGVKKKKSLKSIYANALEAILAAIYLDSNFTTVQEIIIKLWDPYIKESLSKEISLSFNPKSLLQEWTQQNNLSLPIYTDKNKEGTEHSPIFTVSLLISGYDEIIAKASSKRLAQKMAAYNFLKKNNININK